MPVILIADDERYQRLLLREILASDPPFTFVDADDGRQAVELARRERPDLILLDIMMPVMDGFEACRRLKAAPDLRAIPVLLISALGPAPDGESWRAIGAAGFISKPFEEDELRAKVHSALRREHP